MSVHFSSVTDEWATPQPFVDRLAEEFGAFDLDPCALDSSAKAPRWFTPDDDGLAQPWDAVRVWMNPPYGRVIGDWTKKARREVTSRRAAMVVALLPARTDTQWWHRDVMAADEIRFVIGRLKFGDARFNAPFPCAVVIWRGGTGDTRVRAMPAQAAS